MLTVCSFSVGIIGCVRDALEALEYQLTYNNTTQIRFLHHHLEHAAKDGYFVSAI
jgi:hypothetical protein